MMKNIAILGSTGSIGTQTLEIVRYNQDLRVTALAAGSNVRLMEQQIREFGPKLACLWEEEKAAQLRTLVADLDVKVVSGMEGLIETAAEASSDMVVTAVVGMIGIRPTIAAMEAGKDIALANKETLVTAGHIIMPLAAKNGVRILPVDSEHSAIFQCLQGAADNPVHKILLTASGGPFRGRTREQMAGVKVMEARWLFGVGIDQVQVVVQPTSVIHSMVEFEDGAVIAQLGTPDMKLPIQYALYYPQRRRLPGGRLDFTKLRQIEFSVPDMENFRGLKLAYEAGRQGGSMPTGVIAATERAVSLFLNGRIGYLDIVDIIGEAMACHKVQADPDVAGILKAEQETYGFIKDKWNA